MMSLTARSPRIPDPEAAFLGISLGRPYYSDRRIAGYCAWANIKYSRFAFLVGDLLYSYSLQIFKDLSADLALSRSLVIGQSVHRQLEKFLISLKPDTRVIQWSGITSHPSYMSILDICLTLYNDNSLFCQAVRDQVFLNLGSRIAICGASRDTRRRDGKNGLLDSYIMHEVAGLILTSEHLGYPLEIYPGPDLRIITRIYQGEWPQFIPMLAFPPQRRFLTLAIDDTGAPVDLQHEA